MLCLGDLTLPYPFAVAPMAGVSDLPFRMISRRFGVPLAFTEMIDARALGHRDRRTLHMLSSCENDRPLGVQLATNDERQLIEAMKVLEEYEFDLLDLNAACPAPKVAKKGMGAGLLREPARLGALLKVMVERSRVPVTVKIRSGWDLNSLNAVEVAERAEEAGACALFMHGRTKTQGYSGTVDYGIIGDVKRALFIPVIASGDNTSLSAVKRMFEETGCDGVAIARGSLGNPWIFRDVAGYFGNSPLVEGVEVDEVVRVMKDHLDMVIAHYGEKRGISCFRKFFIWYTRGLRGAKPYRDQAFRAAARDDLVEVMEEVGELSRGRS